MSANGRTTNREVGERLGHLEASFDGLTREFRGINNTMADLAKKMDSQTRPQYAVMISLIGLVVVMLAAYSRGPLSDIDRHDTALGALATQTDLDNKEVNRRLDAKIEKLADLMQTHLNQPGHPWMVAKIASIEGAELRNNNTLREQLKELSEKLQSHITTDGHPSGMAQVKAIERMIKQLDVVVQREMRLLDGRIDAVVDGIDARVGALEGDQKARAGGHFDRIDFDKYVLPVQNELRAMLEELRVAINGKGRFSRDDFTKEAVPLLQDLMTRMAALEATEGVRQEKKAN